MIKKSNIKVLLFAMIISIIITSLPMSVFADEVGESYTTKAYVSGYGVKDGDAALVPATTNQTEAINAMKDKARLSWSYGTSNSYSYYIKDMNVSTDQLTIDFGRAYRGILYEQKGYSSTNSNNREHWFSTSSGITNAINYSVTNGYNYIKGTDCSSSVSYAWREATGNNTADNGLLMSTIGHTSGGDYHSTYNTKKIVLDGNNNTSNSSDGYGAFVTRVGQYGDVASNLSNYEDNTADIVSDLTATGNYQGNGTIHNRVYKNIQPGDFLVFRKISSETGNLYGHAMLVKKVVIVYGDDGDGDGIDKSASYVLTNEQTSKWHDCTNILSNGTTESYRTSWILGYAGSGGIKYTFEQLKGKSFLPYRLNDTYATMTTGFIPEQLSETSVNVQWNPQDKSFCSGYVLEYSTDSAFENCEKITLNNPSQSEYTLKGLIKGEKYYIRMNAFYTKDEKTAYAGYNNWVSVDLKDGGLYRENAPNLTKVTQQEYKQYIYDDISYDHEICDDI